MTRVTCAGLKAVLKHCPLEVLKAASVDLKSVKGVQDMLSEANGSLLQNLKLRSSQVSALVFIFFPLWRLSQPHEIINS
jgi:hypothetical protein